MSKKTLSSTSEAVRKISLSRFLAHQDTHRYFRDGIFIKEMDKVIKKQGVNV